MHECLIPDLQSYTKYYTDSLFVNMLEYKVVGLLFLLLTVAISL